MSTNGRSPIERLLDTIDGLAGDDLERAGARVAERRETLLRQEVERLRGLEAALRPKPKSAYTAAEISKFIRSHPAGPAQGAIEFRKLPP